MVYQKMFSHNNRLAKLVGRKKGEKSGSRKWKMRPQHPPSQDLSIHHRQLLPPQAMNSLQAITYVVLFNNARDCPGCVVTI